MIPSAACVYALLAGVGVVQLVLLTLIYLHLFGVRTTARERHARLLERLPAPPPKLAPRRPMGFRRDVAPPPADSDPGRGLVVLPADPLVVYYPEAGDDVGDMERERAG